jgi:hypothetical protein
MQQQFIEYAYQLTTSTTKEEQYSQLKKHKYIHEYHTAY